MAEGMNFLFLRYDICAGADLNLSPPGIFVLSAGQYFTEYIGGSGADSVEIGDSSAIPHHFSGTRKMRYLTI